MSKYGSNPSAFHYKCLKDIAKYLRTSRDWGIQFKRRSADWKENGDIKLLHIPGVINPADDKPLGWILHSRHARYIMGHTSSLPS